MSTRPSSQTDSWVWCLSPNPLHPMKQIGVKRECGCERWQAWGYTEFNLLWMGWTFCRRSWNLKLPRRRSHLSRRWLALTPKSKMFHEPKKFLCSPIRFNEHKSYNQETQGRPMWGQLHAGTIRSTWYADIKSSVPFENGRTVDWELKQFCKM